MVANLSQMHFPDCLILAHLIMKSMFGLFCRQHIGESIQNTPKLPYSEMLWTSLYPDQPRDMWLSVFEALAQDFRAKGTQREFSV